MAYLKLLNRVTQKYGSGTPATIIGQQYKQYRLNNTTTGSIISTSSLISVNFRMYFRGHEKAKRMDVENTTFDLLVFEGMCDGTKLEVGDILVETGYQSDGGQYCVVQQRPMSPNMLIRVESNSAISEPQPAAGSDETQPQVGPMWVEGRYGGPTVKDRYVLTLDNGIYQMLPFGQGTLASVPIGIQPLNRVRDAKLPGIPTSYAHTSFLAYIPPTPGYIPAERDIVKGPTADTYDITQVYTSDGVGVAGTIAILEKLNT